MKTAIITGISKGIGAATALELAGNGYKVLGSYNTDRKGAETVQSNFPDLIEIHQADFSSREGTLSFCKKFSEIKIDALVSNAGIVEFEEFEEFDFNIWDQTMEVNLTTSLVLSQFFFKRMNEGGAVVIVSSTDGMTGTFASLSYAASKAALITLTKGLGNIFGKMGLRVNSIAPGWIDTDMATAASEAASDLTPLGRNGRPEEVADAISYLISKKSSFVNGATLIVDGGYTNVDTIMLKEANGEL